MYESSRIIAGKQVRTWNFDGEGDYIKHRDLIPLHERRRYDLMYSYQESPKQPVALDVSPPLPETAPAAETLTPALTHPTVSTVTTFGPPDLAGTAPTDHNPDPSTPIPDHYPTQVLLGLGYSTPLLLRVQYLRPHPSHVNKYHYFLPPPPMVDVMYLQEGSQIAGDTLLPVSNSDPKGLYWLNVDMEIVWQIVRTVVATEYDGSLVDIGLASGRWIGFKTEYDGKMIAPHTKLGDLILTFNNEKIPGAGQPLIIVVEDEVPYSTEPSVEFEVPVQDDDVPLEAVKSSTSGDRVGSEIVPPQGWSRTGNAYILMEELVEAVATASGVMEIKVSKGWKVPSDIQGADTAHS